MRQQAFAPSLESSKLEELRGLQNGKQLDMRDSTNLTTANQDYLGT